MRSIRQMDRQWLIGENSPLDQLNTLPCRIEEAKRQLSNL